jgi:hypothetical protein
MNALFLSLAIELIAGILRSDIRGHKLRARSMELARKKQK